MMSQQTLSNLGDRLVLGSVVIIETAGQKFREPAPAGSREESVKTPEVVFDGKNLNLVEPRFAGIASQGRGAHHSPRTGGRRIDHPHWQAVESAPPVHEALQLVTGRREFFSDSL